MYRFVLASVLLAALSNSVGAQVHIINCNLSTGKGCTSNPPFSFQQMGETETWNSRCNLNYRLTIAPLHTYGSAGFRCSLFMDVPQSGKYIYSISEDPNANYYTTSTAYIYGYGLDARLVSKNVDINDPDFLNWFVKGGHTTSSDNHDSYVNYKILPNQFDALYSSGTYLRGNSDALFRPNETTTYIGLNSRYPSSYGQGSGLCRIYCATIPTASMTNSNAEPASGGVFGSDNAALP